MQSLRSTLEEVQSVPKAEEVGEKLPQECAPKRITSSFLERVITKYSYINHYQDYSPLPSKLVSIDVKKTLRTVTYGVHHSTSVRISCSIFPP